MLIQRNCVVCRCCCYCCCCCCCCCGGGGGDSGGAGAGAHGGFFVCSLQLCFLFRISDRISEGRAQNRIEHIALELARLIQEGLLYLFLNYLFACFYMFLRSLYLFIR